MRIPESMLNNAQEVKDEYSKKKPEKKYVWHSSRCSIEMGQISILSVVETITVLGLYYILIQYFHHHWWLLLTALAAPIILLRSEASVELGHSMLLEYSYKTDTKTSNETPYFFNFFITILSFIIIFWLFSEHWLLDYNGWSWYWRISICICFIFPFLMTFFSAARGTLIFSNFVISSTAYVDFFDGIFEVIDKTIKSVFKVTSFIGGPIAGVIPAAIGGTVGAICGSLIGIILGVLNIFLWILYIRCFATLRYPIKGLRNLPANWHRVIWCIDISHTPELLPNIDKVNIKLTLHNILRRISDAETGIVEKLVLLVLIPIIYIPAVMWRWSLKSTLWLWWPLTLLLRQPFKTENIYQMRSVIVKIALGLWKWIVIPIAIIIPWLLSNHFPTISEVTNLVLPEHLEKPFTKLMAYAVPPPTSLRYSTT